VLIPELEAAGADIIVLLIHEGGLQSAAPSLPNGCVGISGAIVDIVDRLDPAVDIVVSGHTHQPYNCVIDGRPVTSAFSFGRLVTDYDIQYDRSRADISSLSIDNAVVARTTEDPEVKALVDKYKAVVAPVATRVVGSITADLTRTASPTGESALGDVIADSQLADTVAAGAQIALMNPGGIRVDIPFAASAGGEQPGEVTYGELFAVQPFNNYVVTMTLTGAQLDAVLEQQWLATPTGTLTRILQVSDGFSYVQDVAQPIGDRVQGMTLNGTPIDPAASYRITVNSFLAGGGDGFSQLLLGTDVLFGGLDIDAFEDYLFAHSPLAPPPLDRILAPTP
jgi:5'-nucleotidase